MNLCILDEQNVCVRVIVAETEDPVFLQDGERYAPNHNGGIGMLWDVDKGDWHIEKTEPPEIPTEVLVSNIRSRRDSLLQDTDWIVIKSYERGQNIPAEWELYRQALRDITEQAGFPYEVTWPTKP